MATEYAQDRTGIFDRCAGRLLELLDPASGSALLDVGCGTGAVALQAAARIGPRGRVVGCDLAEAMVSLAQKTASVQGATNATFHQMDAEQLDLPDASFDVVTCAFSLFQFSDMRQALAEMGRVLRRGGRLALSNWGPGYFSPVAGMQRELFKEFGLKPLLANPIVFKPEKLEGLLREAGFVNVKLIEETENVWLESPEQVWAFDLDMGPFPVMLRQQLSVDQRKELKRRFVVLLKDLKQDQGIECTFNLLYALAEKGGGEPVASSQ